jgi:hypothetical protein
MAGTTTGSWWQYSRWLNNIARNARITDPADPLLGFIKTFIAVIWNPATQTGTRPWLDNKFRRLATASGTNYNGDVTLEQPAVLVKMLSYIARDFKKIPLTDFEKFGADIMLSLCENRHLGTGPYYGGVIGDGPVSNTYVLPPT